MYVEGSPYLELPTLSEYEKTLIAYWYEAGSVSQSGMGVGALSWEEIVTWSDRFYSEDIVQWVKSPTNRWMPIGTKQSILMDYEIHIIKFLSQEYASEYHSGSDPHRQCPKEIVVDEIDSLAESTRLGEALIAMFGNKTQ